MDVMKNEILGMNVNRYNPKISLSCGITAPVLGNNELLSLRRRLSMSCSLLVES
jgi:hypothetical protein